MARRPETSWIEIRRRLIGALSGREPVADGKKAGAGASRPERPDADRLRPSPGSAADAEIVFGVRPRVVLRGMHDISPHVSEFRILEQASRPMRCTLALGTEPAAVSGGGVGYGDGIEVLIGTEDAPLFAGAVFGVGLARNADGARRTEIVACDPLALFAYGRRTGGYEEYAAGDVLASVASAYGLTNQIDLESPTEELHVQANESDLEFVARLAGENGGEIWIEDGVFRAAHWAARPGAELSLDSAHQFHTWSVHADLTGQPASLAVRGWNPETAAPIGASVSDIQPAGMAPGRTASDILQQIGISGDRARENVVHDGPGGMDAALSRAAARYVDVARRFALLKADMDGSSALRIGAQLDVGGLSDAFDGRYRIDETEHVFTSAGGYRTSFEASRPVYGGKR